MSAGARRTVTRGTRGRRTKRSRYPTVENLLTLERSTDCRHARLGERQPSDRNSCLRFLLIENVFESSVDSGFGIRGTFRNMIRSTTFLKAFFRSCLGRNARFLTIPTHTRVWRHRDRTRKGGRPSIAPHSRRGVGTAPHRREAAPVEMGEVRGASAESSPRYAIRAVARHARATSRTSRFRFVTLPRWRCSPRANLARGLSPSASLRATLTRLPAFRHDLSSTPDCPRSCGGSPRCAPARTSSRASATNPRAARRRRRESSPTSSRATPGKPCVRRASEDAMSCRCVSDFDAISREDI